LVESQPVQLHLVEQGTVYFLQSNLPLGTIDQVLGDAGLLAALVVRCPVLGEKQFGIEQGLVAAAADAEVDADNAVGDLADTAEVLPLHAGGLGARLEGGGFVDQADAAQVVGSHGGQGGGDVALQLLADVGVSPEVVLE